MEDDAIFEELFARRSHLDLEIERQILKFRKLFRTSKIAHAGSQEFLSVRREFDMDITVDGRDSNIGLSQIKEIIQKLSEFVFVSRKEFRSLAFDQIFQFMFYESIEQALLLSHMELRKIEFGIDQSAHRICEILIFDAHMSDICIPPQSVSLSFERLHFSAKRYFHIIRSRLCYLVLCFCDFGLESSELIGHFRSEGGSYRIDLEDLIHIRRESFHRVDDRIRIVVYRFLSSFDFFEELASS